MAGPAAAIDLPSAFGSTSTVQVQRRCFVDNVRVSGFLAQRAEAFVMGLDGFRIGAILVHEGDTVAAGQDLIRLEAAFPSPPGGATPPGGAGSAEAAAARARPPVIVLKAPAAGVVSASTARLGALATAREPLLRIGTDRDLDLVVDIPGAYAARVKAGGGARILLGDGSEVGTTVRVPPAEIDARTQFARARLALPAGSGLRPGMFGRGTVDTTESCGPSVPKTSIVRQNNTTSVLVVRNGKPEARRVEIGLSSSEFVEIRSGLSEGEGVIANAAGAL
ncbi:HlyD family efflux transporter periplasmic adaptor subunit [Enterovirga sp.]|uniref:efflux RND transporter periplasmic adaptor subunit n=1 Tax=Enterovirga sp. TaxID=2026350 RepID=UPI002CEB4095|nr:HlyD family efflux transporter periplasmic adaptor subunit [Enterovirga sp.]HMO28095.1 efflux RND transporter periplasmic adaptor subunit [Enterovirga sp.]